MNAVFVFQVSFDEFKEGFVSVLSEAVDLFQSTDDEDADNSLDDIDMTDPAS